MCIFTDDDSKESKQKLNLTDLGGSKTMRIAYEFELGLLLKDDKGTFVEREPIHFCVKTELVQLIDYINDLLNDNLDFDLQLSKSTCDYDDWEFGFEINYLDVYPKKGNQFNVPKYIDKAINKVLSEIK